MPICPGCKKIRNDEEFWLNVEDFLRRRTDLQVTHGICPACIDDVRK